MKKRNIFVIFAISVLVLSSCRESSDDVFNPASALNNSYSSYAGQFNTIWNGLDQGYVFFEEGKKQGKADWGTIYSTYMPQFSALDRQMKELPDDVFEAYRTSETSSPIWEMAVGLYKSIANNLIDHHFSMDIHDPYSSKYTTGTIFRISPGNTEVKSRAYYHQTNSEGLIALTTTTTDYSGFTVSDYVASVTSSGYCVSCVFKDGDGNAIPYLLLDLFRVYDICLNYSSAPEDYVVLSNFWESIKIAYDSKSLAGVILDVRGNHGGYTVDTEFLIGMYLNDSYIFTPARTKFKNGPGHYDFTPWVSYSLVSADKDSNLSLSSEVLQDIRSNKVDLVSANVPHAVIPTGIKHGTVTVMFKSNSFEVTTFRTESDYSDSRHPDKVSFVSNLEEDLSRRDFTVNAFAADCTDGKIIDLFNGFEDLKKKTIRAIGNPVERFKEDALRLMRLARFCSKLGFNPDDKTIKAASELSATIYKVSKERVCDELFKILQTKKPSVGLKILETTGLLREILPEVQLCRTIEQTKTNAKDVLEHIYICTDAAAYFDYSFDVRLAALLHDIGKPETLVVSPFNTMHFPKHEIAGAELAQKVLKRLKCSNKILEKNKILIENHMVKYKSDWNDGTVKRFINRVGKENINELFELQWCDQIASEGKSKAEQYDEFIRRIKELQTEPLTVKDLNVTGNDLIQAGIPAGRAVGQILNKLLEMVIDYPNLNINKTLIEQSLILYNNHLCNGQ